MNCFGFMRKRFSALNGHSEFSYLGYVTLAIFRDRVRQGFPNGEADG
jgi:hypothetical protein